MANAYAEQTFPGNPRLAWIYYKMTVKNIAIHNRYGAQTKMRDHLNG